MKLLFAGDHAGFEMKKELIGFVRALGHEVEDLGPHVYDPNDDYPDFVIPLAHKVAQARTYADGTQTAAEKSQRKSASSQRESVVRGIVVAGSGQGEIIAMNRIPGVRAALFCPCTGTQMNADAKDADERRCTVGVELIKASRGHNDSNILAIGARFCTMDVAKEAVKLWLETPFSGDERHIRRLRKIESAIKKSGGGDSPHAAAKDFDGWNEKKKEIHEIRERVYFKDGEIWWVNLGCNVGFEIDGKGTAHTRPVVVLKKYNQFSFLAVPLGTVTKTNQYKIPIGAVGGKDAVAIISQLRNIDSKRLVRKIGYLPSEFLSELKRKVSRANIG